MTVPDAHPKHRVIDTTRRSSIGSEWSRSLTWETGRLRKGGPGMGMKTARVLLLAITIAALAAGVLGTGAFADTGGPGITVPILAVQTR